MRRSKRVISKAKMYGFNPWMDQVDAVNQIMDETGEKSEAALLRKLIDEALAARRGKTSTLTPTEAERGSDETLLTIQTLLLKLIRQGETSLRIQDVTLALVQDTLAEAHAARKAVWNSEVSALTDEGLDSEEIARRFEQATNDAKDYAYGVAEQIQKSEVSR